MEEIGDFAIRLQRQVEAIREGFQVIYKDEEFEFCLDFKDR